MSSSAPESSEVPPRLVVDANPILSALLTERGAASRIFWSTPAIQFATTAHTISEVAQYLPDLAQKIGRSEELLDMSLRLLPLAIHERSAYEGRLSEARDRIAARDPNDVDLLALALHLQAPIWSNDQDFSDAGVPWFTTASLLAMLEAGGITQG